MIDCACARTAKEAMAVARPAAASLAMRRVSAAQATRHGMLALPRRRRQKIRRWQLHRRLLRSGPAAEVDQTCGASLCWVPSGAGRGGRCVPGCPLPAALASSLDSNLLRWEDWGREGEGAQSLRLRLRPARAQRLDRLRSCGGATQRGRNDALLNPIGRRLTRNAREERTRRPRCAPHVGIGRWCGHPHATHRRRGGRVGARRCEAATTHAHCAAAVVVGR
eukprot:6181436-Pleurochrysis_carterae.AAC.1